LFQLFFGATAAARLARREYSRGGNRLPSRRSIRRRRAYCLNVRMIFVAVFEVGSQFLFGEMFPPFLRIAF
jgi:hypothetical protein